MLVRMTGHSCQPWIPMPNQANKTVVENLVLAGAFDSTDPNRKALFWNLGRLAEVAASHRTAIDAKKTSGQASLLDIKQTSTEVRKAIPSPYHSSDVSDAFRLPAAPLRPTQAIQLSISLISPIGRSSSMKHRYSALRIPPCHGVLPPCAHARRDLGFAQDLISRSRANRARGRACSPPAQATYEKRQNRCLPLARR